MTTSLRQRLRHLSIAALACVSPLAGAATFVVNSTGAAGDNQPGDGVCATGAQIALPSGSRDECTLAAAIEETNVLIGHDEVVFSHQIDDDDYPFVVIDSSIEYRISGPLLIDGFSAPGYDLANPEQVPLVNITTSGATDTAFIVTPQAAGTELRGLAVFGYANAGIVIEASDVRVQGSHIGLAYGVVVPGNDGPGIRVTDTAANVSIGLVADAAGGYAGRHNVISGNGGSGLFVQSPTATIIGNRIGTNAEGTDVQIGGAATGNRSDGIEMSRGRGRISHNTIAGNDGAGIIALFEIPGNHDLLILDNLVGTDVTGRVGLGNESSGIVLKNLGADSHTQVLRNVVADNRNHGIALTNFNHDDAALVDTLIQANRIGVDLDGTSALGNGGHGIVVGDNVFNTMIFDNILGGNTDAGVYLDAGAWGVTLSGNWIGTNEAGMRLGNGGHGIETRGTTHSIGGIVPGDANVIGDNGLDGIAIRAVMGGVTVLGNYIGTDARGVDLGNAGHGISMGGSDLNSNAGHTIGSVAAGSGNTIGFNAGDGIHVAGDDNRIRGNFVGTDRYRRDLGNHGNGIYLGTQPLSFSSSVQNTIGAAADSHADDLPAARNAIGFNDGAGVHLAASVSAWVGVERNLVRGNEILSNGGLGIDLNPVGANGNDPNDFDNGSNQGQNSPELDPNVTRVTDDGDLVVLYKVASDVDAAAYPLTIDFYLADGDAQEGRVHVGTHSYAHADAGQTVNIVVTPPPGTVVQGQLVATATDSSAPGNTSEFSSPVVVSAALPCGDVNLDGAVDVRDVHDMRAHLADPGSASLTGPALDRCDVVAGDGACSLTDALVLTRFAAGPALGPGVQAVCDVN